MAGYVACARLSGGAPRFIGSGVAVPGPTRPNAELIDPWIDDPERIELVGRPLDERLADWLAGLREAWSQTTFYLFDPQSWR